MLPIPSEDRVSNFLPYTSFTNILHRIAPNQILSFKPAFQSLPILGPLWLCSTVGRDIYAKLIMLIIRFDFNDVLLRTCRVVLVTRPFLSRVHVFSSSRV